MAVGDAIDLDSYALAATNLIDRACVRMCVGVDETRQDVRSGSQVLL